jgi:hypothetical protein
MSYHRCKIPAALFAALLFGLPGGAEARGEARSYAIVVAH